MYPRNSRVSGLPLSLKWYSEVILFFGVKFAEEENDLVLEGKCFERFLKEIWLQPIMYCNNFGRPSSCTEIPLSSLWLELPKKDEQAPVDDQIGFGTQSTKILFLRYKWYDNRLLLLTL